jgi:hypothetical protein
MKIKSVFTENKFNFCWNGKGYYYGSVEILTTLMFDNKCNLNIISKTQCTND